MAAAVRSARGPRRVSGGKRRPAIQISSPNAAAATLIAHAVVLTPSWRIAAIPMRSAGSGAQAGKPALRISRGEGICVESIAACARVAAV